MSLGSRRHFLQSALAAGAGFACAGTGSAIEPIQRNGKSHIRLSLAAYSYRDYLNLKKPTMTLLEFAGDAADMALDAIEPTQYYFAETTPAYLAALKGKCTRLGLDISGTAINNNFCLTDPAKAKAQIEVVKQWVEHTSRLGGKTIRIFSGDVDRKDKSDTEEKARARCIASIQEACDYAGKYGVYLALENHGGISSSSDQLLAIVKGVQHDWFGVNLDTGNFRSADPYADMAKLAPYAVVVQVKTHIHRTGMAVEDADLKRIIEILRSVNYRGYVALEYEAKEEPKVAVPRHIKTLQQIVRATQSA